MRVLHVIGEMGFGGAEVLTSQMATRMVSSGQNVEILVLGFCEPVVLSAIRASGVIVHSPESALGNPVNALRIARLVASQSIDVVHVHLFPALYWAALAKALCRSRVKWVYTEHSTSNGRRSRRLLRPLERWVYRQYDAVVCISVEAKNALSRWVPAVSPEVIGNGIDLARFSDALPVGRAELGISPAGTLVLMVGAFRPEKNQARLVESLLRLPSDFFLVLAGDGAERGPVQCVVDECGLSSRVFFLGAVPGVERLYKMADVYVLPSKFEGFGISALEAAAAGVPVVYSDVPGLSDMLDGAGWAVDPLSAESIARGIAEAAAAGRSSPQVAHGRAVAARYGLDATIAKHVSLYQSLVAPGAAATPSSADQHGREP